MPPETKTSFDPKYEIENQSQNFWHSVESKIKNYFTSVQENLKHDSEEDRKKDLKGYIEKEKNFTELILQKFLENLKPNSNDLTILFDIDETILTSKISENGRTYFLRPSIKPLLEEIKNISESKNSQINFGTLSSRSEEKIKTQLEKEGELHDLKNFFNQEFINSDRNIEVPFEAENNFEEYSKKYLSEILDAEKVDPYPNHGDITKILKLKQLIEKYPNKKFLVIDDFEFPNWIKENTNTVGISLRNEAKPATFYL
jgi:hypothetical protein